MWTREEIYGLFARIIRITSIIAGGLGLFVLVRKYGVPWWVGALIIFTPAALSHFEGLITNLKKNLKNE